MSLALTQSISAPDATVLARKPSPLLRKQGKGQVYFNEYNLMMGDATYLPLVSGSLQAYAQSDPVVKDRYEFGRFMFHRDNPEAIVAKHDNPDVAAFSVSMWNAKLSLEVARRVKEKFPECLVVFGGPQVPFDATDYLIEHPYIDVTVRSDGERIFSKVLERNLHSRDFGGIESISFKGEDGPIVNRTEQDLVKDLDVYPSPYTNGVFEALLKSHPDIKFQAIIETNRGCPFPCSFCFWGQGGLNQKYRFFSEDRVKNIAEWLGKNKIEYVFCADSNFGMLPRDVGIAKAIADVKARHGYPQRFRVCYGKNKLDTVFETAKVLSDADLAKGITLARQSNDAETLRINGRQNISIAMYDELQERYHKDGMTTYSELILGLPGETYASFKKGLEEIIAGGIDNQSYVYHCQVYPNTELDKPEFRKEQNMRTRKIPLTEVHCEIRAQDAVTEEEEIIVGTKYMSETDWQRGSVLSWTSQMFHGLGAGFFVSNYLHRRFDVEYTDFFEFVADKRMSSSAKRLHEIVDTFRKGAEDILAGKPRTTTMPDFRDLYFDHEEAGFFRISEDRDHFYNDLGIVVKEFLHKNGKEFNEAELDEVIKYQKVRTPDFKQLAEEQFSFEYNVPEFFDKFFDEEVPIVKKNQSIALVELVNHKGDKQSFAADIIRKRRNNAILRKVRITA